MSGGDVDEENPCLHIFFSCVQKYFPVSLRLIRILKELK